MTSSNVGTGDVAGQAGGDPADLMRRIGELIAEFANKALGQLSDPAREWLVANVPVARAHLYGHEGHISLVRQLPRILDDLLSRADA